jgi:hypothetical protein
MQEQLIIYFPRSFDKAYSTFLKSSAHIQIASTDLIFTDRKNVHLVRLTLQKEEESVSGFFTDINSGCKYNLEISKLRINFVMSNTQKYTSTTFIKIYVLL